MFRAKSFEACLLYNHVTHALFARINRWRERTREGDHTLRASPLPVYVRALHPSTLRPLARAIVPDTVSTVIVTRERTHSYGINRKMSWHDAQSLLSSPRFASRRFASSRLVSPLLALPGFTSRRVVASRPRGTSVTYM